MKLVKSRLAHPQVEPLLRQELQVCPSGRKRLMLTVLVLVSMMICAWPGTQTFAADLPENERSVPGTVLPSSGSTPGPGVSPEMQTSSPSSANAAPRSAAAQRDRRCATLQKMYAQSEACFARYRMKNHGLRPDAFQRCKQMKDPSSDCGPAVVQ